MSSEVDICNLALAHLGDSADVSAISPPDGSAQSVYCARFYPIARDSLLEVHDWNFATRRAVLPLLGAGSDMGINQWLYVYGVPTDCLNPVAVLDSAATDDFSQDIPLAGSLLDVAPTQGVYTPQDYVMETLTDDTQVILTNQENALLRYVAKVTDPTTFSPLFIDTLALFLASKLAGPLLRGEEGRAVAKDLMGEARAMLGQATTSDAAQRRVRVSQSTPWMVNR